MKRLLLALCLTMSCSVAAAADVGRISVRTEVQFAPSPETTASVVRFIGEAKTTLLITAYSLTNAPVATAIADAVKRGVQTRVICDSPQYYLTSSKCETIRASGADVRYNVRSGIMHNKYMVSDTMHVQTGSFNYSDSAEKKNAENILFLRGSSALARAYTENFEKLWLESKTAAQMAAAQ